MAEKPAGPPKGASQKGRLNIKVADDVARGVYSNFSILHNNENEFVLDFVFVEPQRAQGQVVSRVTTSPKSAKRLLAGLQRMVAVYEERFGEINLAQEPPDPKGTYH